MILKAFRCCRHYRRVQSRVFVALLGPRSDSEQVMKEFPSVFNISQTWHGETLCDGMRAEDRAKWLVENQQMAIEDTRPAHLTSYLAA